MPILELIREDGLYYTENYLTHKQCKNLLKEASEVEELYYNDINLNSRAVYIADKTETRHSMAIMANVKNKQPHEYIPTVNFQHRHTRRQLHVYNNILSNFTATEVDPYSRSLINYQFYYKESKPVAEHFDGDLMICEHGNMENLVIKEALLPRLVMVLVLHNENDEGNSGIVLRNMYNNTIVKVHLLAGSMIVFDNTIYRHAVPSLKKPRITLGFRNFDHLPYHFLSKDNGIGRVGDYEEVIDEANPGWIKSLTNREADNVTIRFNRDKWPKIREKHFSSEVIF